jgi:MFS family permease
VALYLPRTQAARQTEGGRDAGSFRSAAVWRLSFFATVYACLYFVLSTDGSVYIEGSGLGTAALTGWMSSLSCAVAGVAAALYGSVRRRVGRATFPLAFALIGAGYLFAGLHVSVFGAAVAFLAGALGISLFTPWLMTAISDAAGQANAPVATAIVLTCVNVGYFLSPYLSGPLARLAGDGSPGAFGVFGVLALLFGAAAAIQCRRHDPI